MEAFLTDTGSRASVCGEHLSLGESWAWPGCAAQGGPPPLGLMAYLRSEPEDTFGALGPIGFRLHHP